MGARGRFMRDSEGTERGGEMRERLWTKDFILICAVNFFMFAGFFLLLPTLPIYVVDELGGAAGQAGRIVAVFTAAAVQAPALSGNGMERVRRPGHLALRVGLASADSPARPAG